MKEYRRVKQIERYRPLTDVLLSQREQVYVHHAAKGMSISEIAELCDVSKQCVSAALRSAELKAAGKKSTRTTEVKTVKKFMRLVDIPTKELVEELQKREGVAATVIDPSASTEIKADGPAIVLTVID